MTDALSTVNLDVLIPYFKTYGYYVLFLGLFLENTVIIGLILPGETVLLAAAFLAARDILSIEQVFVVGFIAAIGGNLLGYFLGRLGGFVFIERFSKRLHIPSSTLQTAEEYFAKHGGKTVFIGRFASVIRVFISIIAGASKMPLLIFTAYTLAAVTLWTAAICILGYYFGQNWELLVKLMAGFGWLVLAILLITGVGFWLRRRK